MGIFDKILPWKKKDELGMENLNLGLNQNMNLGLGQNMNLGIQGMPNTPMMDQIQSQQPMGFQQQPYPSYPAQQQMGYPQETPQMESFQRNQNYERNYAAGKDIEVVSAKLDAIKAALETLNQRLASIERYIQTDQELKRRSW
jgi:hypothetical protein